MGSGTNSTTPWQKLCKFITNPTVEVILAIVVVLVAAWVVIETETAQRRSPEEIPGFFSPR